MTSGAAGLYREVQELRRVLADTKADADRYKLAGEAIERGREYHRARADNAEASLLEARTERDELLVTLTELATTVNPAVTAMMAEHVFQHEVYGDGYHEPAESSVGCSCGAHYGSWMQGQSGDDMPDESDWPGIHLEHVLSMQLGAARRDGARQALEAAGDAIDALYKAKGASKDYANLSYQEGYLDGLDAAEQLVRPASVDASLPVLGLATPEPPTPKEQQQ